MKYIDMIIMINFWQPFGEEIECILTSINAKVSKYGKCLRQND